MSSDRPGAGDTAEQQRRALRLGLERTRLGLDALWLRYVSLGGDAGLLEVEAYLHRLMPLPRMQRDVLAHALNEYVTEFRDELAVPYGHVLAPSLPAREGLTRLTSPTSAQGPLAAAVLLLRSVERGPAERLVVAVEAAGDALGVHFGLHLVDDAQTGLLPLLPHPADRHGFLVGAAVDVDTTVAGQAYRQVRTVPGGEGDRDGAEGRSTWWMPLLDGGERLGVLEVGLSGPGGPGDERLRRECEWTCRLIGSLVGAVGRSGDGFDVLRRSGPRTPAAELVGDLLPPLTVVGDDVVVTAGSAAGDGEGGDAFDHALSPTRAHLAVFDATGHSVTSGSVAAAALAGSRSVRRGGGGLLDQARAVDDLVLGRFADRGLPVTGVLAELELGTGRLDYLVAGHPGPLLLREGETVRRLEGGGRTPFGTDGSAVAVGREDLHPGDVLVLHTDGVTGALGEDGAPFGPERLQAFVRRSSAAGDPLPETVRRVLRAVREHRSGRLQDDATVQLTTWAPRPVVPVLDLDLDAVVAAG